MKKEYITGYKVNGVLHFRKEDGNTTEDKNEAKLYTLKQAHKWFWGMRKNSVNTAWGYWRKVDLK